MQERRNSIANTLELCLSCTNPSIWYRKILLIYCQQTAHSLPMRVRYGVILVVQSWIYAVPFFMTSWIYTLCVTGLFCGESTGYTKGQWCRALKVFFSLQWRHNEHDGISNHWRLDCLLRRLFKHRSQKTSKLYLTGLCEENPPVTGGFPSQRVSKVRNVSIWWHHHEPVITGPACI